MGQKKRRVNEQGVSVESDEGSRDSNKKSKNGETTDTNELAAAAGQPRQDQ